MERDDEGDSTVLGLGPPGVAETRVAREVVRLSPGVGEARGEWLGLLRGEKTLNDAVTLVVPVVWKPATEPAEVEEYGCGPVSEVSEVELPETGLAGRDDLVR